MKVLILHHVEPLWESALKKFFNTTFDELELKIYEYLQENKFDKVILTRFEDWQIKNGEYNYIGELINKVYDYAYGWDADCLVNDPENYTKGGNHSEAVFIADWQRELKGNEVFIAGAFDGECLEDLEIALEHCEVKYNRIEELIY